MASETDEEALNIVAKAVGDVPHQRAMAAALVRYAGNAYAQVTSHEDAFLLHTRLARRHQERMSHRGAQK